jgi:thiamine transport system substrate-binding protein
MMRRWFVMALTVLLAAATACGDDADTPTGTQGTSATAATTAAPRPGDGERVVLLTHDSFAMSDGIGEEFEASTGYRLEVLRAGDAGSVVNQAVLTRGDPLGDVLYGIDDTFLTRALDAGVFEPYAPADLERVPDEFELDAEHRVTPIDYGDVCLNYDKDYFSGDLAPPASLDDLRDPRYEGLTVVPDAALSSPGLAFLLATIERYGDEWPGYWRDLRENGVLVAADWESAYFTHFTVGGGGDRPIVVSYASSPPADIVFAEEPKDEPAIGVVEDGCYRQIEFAGVLAGASNPQGARALVDFLLSKSFQEDMPLNMFVFPVRDDAELPPVFREFAATPADPLRIPPDEIGARRQEWIEQWTEIVGA